MWPSFCTQFLYGFCSPIETLATEPNIRLIRCSWKRKCAEREVHSTSHTLSWLRLLDEHCCSPYVCACATACVPLRSFRDISSTAAHGWLALPRSTSTSKLFLIFAQSYYGIYSFIRWLVARWLWKSRAARACQAQHFVECMCADDVGCDGARMLCTQPNSHGLSSWRRDKSFCWHFLFLAFALLLSVYRLGWTMLTVAPTKSFAVIMLMRL